jgi:hypothetical protein
MTAPTLLDIRAIAARLDLNERTVRNYHQQAVHNRSCAVHTPACRPKAGDFPEPDARFGGHPAWQESTVDQWASNRPGRGAGGGRPRIIEAPSNQALAGAPETK